MQAISLEIGLHLPEYETVVKRTKSITEKKILMWFHSDEEQLKDYFGDRECFWRIGIMGTVLDQNINLFLEN